MSRDVFRGNNIWNLPSVTFHRGLGGGGGRGTGFDESVLFCHVCDKLLLDENFVIVQS